MNPSKPPPPPHPPDIVLVGCVKTKHAARSPAKNLYSSPLWRCRRAYAESLGVPWYILSALHGLLDPDRRIDPYELALADLRTRAQRAWSARVLAQLKRRVPSMRDKMIEIHAGATYIDHGLEEGLRDAGAAVHRPLAGIAGIGHQQAWYRERSDAHGKAGQSRSPARPHAARLAKLIADDFYGDGLDLASRNMDPGQPWHDYMPEVAVVRRLRGTDRAVRLFLTFIAALDRARDATQLWNAGGRLFEESPESFDPHHVAGLEVGALGRVLKAARVSQRHGPDSDAWHRIARSLSSGRKSPVSRVTATRGRTLAKAKPVIQENWTNGVSEADIAGPAGIEGTCAALDPALWFFGKHGCGHCRKANEKVRFGRACEFCVRVDRGTPE